jgi:hypothetical protein
MDARIAWVLNLDADFELAFGLGYTPNKSVLDAVRLHSASLVGTLTRKRDRIIDEATVPGSARDFTGRAFCPTPRAIAALVRAGAEPEPHPSFEIVRHVNARAFCQSLGPTLPNASFETDRAAAEKKLRSDPIHGDGWRVKRSFGVAGRGQRVHRSGESTSFLGSWIGEGGVQIEPNVEVLAELGLHGMLASNGDVALGTPLTQTCDAAGAWISSARAPDHPRAPALREEAMHVASALHAAGYFGPFGIDAFEWRSKDGTIAFQRRSEINARYSMGFALGFSSCESDSAD